ncbi:TPM domain-containing protein [Ramlibacter sp. WS9]|uniref:TPM domain-containing protein n=1 Tax=Ramlibacter sp. WS9 TaxID=1882741 RepID=UPI0011422EA2|nr:TPM domain-containing protein [Ramlibacter sp. WS9]ROZ78939.1 TPM domain-containing protein [Ramlibacter sp. WS9]
MQHRKPQGFIKRMLRHRWLDESDTRKAMPPDMVERIARRVAASEKRHTGEVRIYVEAGLPLSYLWRSATPRERAVAMFGKLRVWDTEHNNGVLIYLLLAEHAIEVVADRGLARHVPPEEWRAIVVRLGAALHEGRFEDGLTQALEEVSALLVQHFPASESDANDNELPDEPVLG